MVHTPKKYKIEVEAEKLLRELRIQLRKVVAYFFTIPKKKDDKMIYVLETLSWIFLTIALILRIGR